MLSWALISSRDSYIFTEYSDALFKKAFFDKFGYSSKSEADFALSCSEIFLRLCSEGIRLSSLKLMLLGSFGKFDILLEFLDLRSESEQLCYSFEGCSGM